MYAFAPVGIAANTNAAAGIAGSLSAYATATVNDEVSVYAWSRRVVSSSPRAPAEISSVGSAGWTIFSIWSRLFGHGIMSAEVLRGTSRRQLFDR